VRRSATSELTRPGHKSRSQEQVTRAGHKNRAQCGGYLSRQWQSHQRNGRDLTGIVHRHGHALTGSQQPQTARVERDPAERHNGSIVEEGCPRSAQRVVASHRRLQCPHRPAPPALPLRPCPSGPAPPALPLCPCGPAPAGGSAQSNRAPKRGLQDPVNEFREGYAGRRPHQRKARAGRDTGHSVDLVDQDPAVRRVEEIHPGQPFA
jgi:hypothetical protein